MSHRGLARRVHGRTRSNVVGTVGSGLLAGMVVLTGCQTGPMFEIPTPSATTAPPASIATATTSPAPSDPVAPSLSPAPTMPVPEGGILIITAEDRDGTLEVSAMLPDVSESGGTCTLEIVGVDATASHEASQGNGVTYCGLLSLRPAAGDSSGWQFRVTYLSPTTTAESAVSTLEAHR